VAKWLAVVPLTGPVVIPAPAPARASLLVIVVAEAAMGTCEVVMPEMPLELADHEHTDGLAAVQDRYVLLPEGCAAGNSTV